MALKIVLAGFFLLEIMSLGLCCPNNCVICLNSILICNKFKQNQWVPKSQWCIYNYIYGKFAILTDNHIYYHFCRILSGKYSIPTVNDGAFVNAEIVTLLLVVLYCNLWLSWTYYICNQPHRYLNYIVVIVTFELVCLYYILQYNIQNVCTALNCVVVIIN